MKKELVDILACPVCKTNLELTIKEKNASGEVLEGSLYCRKCGHNYSIKEGIPNLLPPSLDRKDNAPL
ncbi:MAG TPA: methytransferase partner Trm112 [Candidatus Atribacteria bacterium]|nr:methytransferase partner Trm112 [Candidatus Atribacteria bacterium]